jgi:hypothetical protein
MRYIGVMLEERFSLLLRGSGLPHWRCGSSGAGISHHHLYEALVLGNAGLFSTLPISVWFIKYNQPFGVAGCLV